MVSSVFPCTLIRFPLQAKKLESYVCFDRMTVEVTDSMKLTDTELALCDREWVERVLQPGEEVLMVCKPQARLWRSEYSDGALFAIVWIAAVCGFSIVLVPHVLAEAFEKPAGLLVLLFMLPFWLVSAVFISLPWLNRAVARRTIYLLTNRRAVVLAPNYLMRPTQTDYPLVPDMIQDVRVRPDGSGDVVLGYEECNTRHGTHLEPKGFMRVPQVQQVSAIVREYMPEPPPMPPPAAPEMWVPASAGGCGADDAPPAEFPNVLTLIVGGLFFVGGSVAVVKSVQQVLNGQLYGWVMTIINVGFPALFAWAGWQAMGDWVQRFKEYRRRRR